MGAFVGDKASDRPTPRRADSSGTNSLQQMPYRPGPLTHDSSRAASPAGATAPCWICAIGTARLQTPDARLSSLPVSGATPLRRRDKTCSGLFVEATDLTPTGGVVSSRRPDWKINLSPPLPAFILFLFCVIIILSLPKTLGRRPAGLSPLPLMGNELDRDTLEWAGSGHDRE